MSTVPRSARIRQTPLAEVGKLTLITDRFELVVPPNIRTLEGFRTWAAADDFPERVRVTYLSGEVYIDMSNEEINTHVGLKTRVISTLGSLVKTAKVGKLYGDGVLLSNDAGQLSHNPDAVFLSRESLVAGRVRLVPCQGAEHFYRELEGTPDWILEIVSDSSVRKDTVQLRDAYHRAGIPEYWLIDARAEEQSFQILVHRKNGYVAAAKRDGWQHSKAFGRWFRLERQLDDFGLWDYTLHIRDE
jgi:Uma2 family endonuclease